MVVAPLFITDMDTLRRRLRLSELDAQNDADEILNSVVREARVEFQQTLGLTRIAEIVAYNQSDTPATEPEVQRALAESTELKIVKGLLADSLPVVFLDGSPGEQQMWNDEATFRDAHRGELNSLIRRLRRVIDPAMIVLKKGNKIDLDSGFFQAVVPEDPVPKPAGSVFDGFNGTGEVPRL